MSAIEVHRRVRSTGGQPTAEASGHRQLLVRPIADPARSIDVSDAVTRAVAHAIWEQVGGNAALNWLEAERLVQNLLSRVSLPVVEPAESTPRPIAATGARAKVSIEPKDDIAGRIGVDAGASVCQVA